MHNELMKKKKTSKQIEIKRPPRAMLSREETIKRMQEFPKRKEQFLAALRAHKS